MTLLDDFLVRAGLAGLGTAVACGPLGCFVVWRRMAYFGDATAHGAILGVALALALALPVAAGVAVAALAMALGVAAMTGRRLPVDTALGVAAHGGLAAGLVAVALAAPGAVDLESYLFGEILAVGRADLAVIWAGALAILGLIAWRWSALLAATLDPELAAASGIDAKAAERWLMVGLALAVVVALKSVGALLVTAMLIVPAAAARPLARTPEEMAVGAVLLGGLAVLGGLQGSLWADTPTGPSIVVAAVVLFALTHLLARR